MGVREMTVSDSVVPQFNFWLREGVYIGGGSHENNYIITLGSSTVLLPYS